MDGLKGREEGEGESRKRKCLKKVVRLKREEKKGES